MNKTETKKFALRVQGLISKKLRKLLNSKSEDKLEFMQTILTEGESFNPDAKYLVHFKVDLGKSFANKFRSALWPDFFEKDWHKELNNPKKPGKSFETENEVISSLVWATNLDFCRQWLKTEGCELRELIDGYVSFFVNHTKCNWYQGEAYFFTYFVNKTIELYPELIVKP